MNFDDIISPPITDYKFHTLEDLDGKGKLAISTSFERGLSVLSVHDSADETVMVKIEDLAEIVGASAKVEAPEVEQAEAPEVERSTLETPERVIRIGDGNFEVASRIFRNDTIKVRAGGLGDNLILEDGKGFQFVLGLATIEAIVKASGLKPGPELRVMTPRDLEEEAEEALSRLKSGAAVELAEPKGISHIALLPLGETAEIIVRADADAPREFFVPGGHGVDGKWWLTARDVRELDLTAEDFNTSYAGQRPEWLEAEVIRADLEGERVFAVRDEDDDWMVYGGERDNDFVMSYEAETDFSDVEIVKA